MKDEDKTKGQLTNELVELRHRIAQVEASESECKRTEKALRESEERFRNSDQRPMACCGNSKRHHRS
jgi:prefoldin subunit 5